MAGVLLLLLFGHQAILREVAPKFTEAMACFAKYDKTFEAESLVLVFTSSPLSEQSAMPATCANADLAQNF